MPTAARRIASTLAALMTCAFPSFSLAGDLNPPPGSVSSTQKPLAEVEPRTAINAQNTPPSAGASFVIVREGSYYLTDNISADAAKDAIHISIDNVTLDLNGFTIDGTDATGPSTAISITDAYVGITIANGNIANWLDQGIHGEDATEIEIHNIRFSDNAGEAILVGGAEHCHDCAFHRCDGAFGATDVSILEDALITDCTGTAVAVGNGAIVRRCTIRNSGTFAIRLSGSDGLIEHNSILDTPNIGINVATGAGTTVRDNSVINGAVGLLASSAGNTIADNTVEANIINYDFAAGNSLGLLLSEIPQTISWPAHVTLAGDLTGSAGQDGITIAAEGVTIDLNGFTLIGVPGSLNGIIDTTNPGGITIRNGAVRGWGVRGVDLSGTIGNRYESVNLVANTTSGISTGSSATILKCNAWDNGVFGFVVGNDCVVTECVAYNNGAQGINTGLGCSVANCTAYVNGQQGIQTAFGSTITQCAANNNALNGIVTSPGCTIVDCALTNTIYGINAGQGSVVDRCVSGRNGSGGIRVSDGCIIRNNTCFDNDTGPGIDIVAQGDYARVEGNHCYLNDVGINCDAAGCFIARNTCTNNTTNWDVAAGNICLVVGATPTGAAILGDSGGVSPGSTDPNANFSH